MNRRCCGHDVTGVHDGAVPEAYVHLRHMFTSLKPYAVT